jgi:hypothetical protein
MIGSPTRFARADGKALSVLKQLRKKSLAEIPVAIFDTYGPVPTDPKELEKSRKWLFPGAAGTMQRMAKEQGLNVYLEILCCEVLGGLRGPLADHQLEKATLFTKNFISTINKGH